MDFVLFGFFERYEIYHSMLKSFSMKHVLPYCLWVKNKVMKVVGTANHRGHPYLSWNIEVSFGTAQSKRAGDAFTSAILRFNGATRKVKLCRRIGGHENKRDSQSNKRLCCCFVGGASTFISNDFRIPKFTLRSSFLIEACGKRQCRNTDSSHEHRVRCDIVLDHAR